MITTEIKAKVFAQYFGQYITKDNQTCELTSVWHGHVSGIHHDGWKLILRPLQDITDEEAIEVAKHYDSHVNLTSLSRQFCIANGRYQVRLFLDGDIRIHHLLFQYLQSRGFDLPNFYLDGKTLKECDLCIYKNELV